MSYIKAVDCSASPEVCEREWYTGAMRWWIIAVLAGCYDPTPPRGIPCSAAGTCPEGQSCDRSQGLCSPDPQQLDAANPGGVTPPDAFVLDPGPAWGTPQPVASVNTTDAETDPALSADGLELLFSSNRAGVGGYDIYRSTRASTSVEFGAPTLLLTLATADDEQAPELTSDGLTVYFRRNDDIYRAVRSAVGQPFANVQKDDELSTAFVDTNPSISADGLVASTTRNVTSTHRELYLFERGTPASPWGSPRRIAELVTAGVDSAACLDQHGLAMYFHSNRPGGAGADDLWFTARPGKGAPFLPPVQIGSLSTSVGESDPSLDATRTIIVFERASEIYMATR